MAVATPRPSKTTGDMKGGDKPASGGSVTLNGSGSTFQKAFQEVAIEAFKKANPNDQDQLRRLAARARAARTSPTWSSTSPAPTAPYKDADCGEGQGR